MAELDKEDQQKDRDILTNVNQAIDYLMSGPGAEQFNAYVAREDTEQAKTAILNRIKFNTTKADFKDLYGMEQEQAEYS